MSSNGGKPVFKKSMTMKMDDVVDSNVPMPEFKANDFDAIETKIREIRKDSKVMDINSLVAKHEAFEKSHPRLYARCLDDDFFEKFQRFIRSRAERVQQGKQSYMEASQQLSKEGYDHFHKSS